MNISENKELIFDLRRQFLRTRVTENLKWTRNTPFLDKKQTKAKLSPQIIRNLRRYLVGSDLAKQKMAFRTAQVYNV